MVSLDHSELTHWGRVKHICINKLTIIGSDNGLSPGLHQAIISTIDGILLIWPLGINFNKILIEIHICSCKNAFEMSFTKCQPSCLGLSVSSLLWKMDAIRQKDYSHVTISLNDESGYVCQLLRENFSTYKVLQVLSDSRLHVISISSVCLLNASNLTRVPLKNRCAVI